MSKWRPFPANCLYAIGDIHGNANELKVLTNRILPLRKSDGAHDTLVFLGDYVDRGPNSFEVIEHLIEIQKTQKNAHFLRGNHEWLMLAALGLIEFDRLKYKTDPYYMWCVNGGLDTLRSYAAQKSGFPDENYYPSLDEVKTLIPQSHIDFLLSTLPYLEHNNYIFVHGGINPSENYETQDKELLLWDRSAYKLVKNSEEMNIQIPWEDKCIVAGHNYDGPFFNEKFIMLDASASYKIVLAELGSLKAGSVLINKKKIEFFDLTKCTAPKKIKKKKLFFRSTIM